MSFAPREIPRIGGAREAAKFINDADYFAFVVTNQSSLARGLYKDGYLQEFHDWLADKLLKIGSRIDRFEYATSIPKPPSNTIDVQVPGANPSLAKPEARAS